MKSFSCIVLLLTIFAATSFAASARRYFNNPRHPGKCAIRENLILTPGDMIKDPNQACGRIMCMDYGLTMFHSCGVQVVEGCELGDYVDKSLPYPSCCRRHVICD